MQLAKASSIGKNRKYFTSLPTCRWTCSSPGGEWLGKDCGKYRKHGEALWPQCRACGSAKQQQRQWIDRQTNRTFAFTTAGRSLAAPLCQEHGANLETKAWPLEASDSAGCTHAPHPEESRHTFRKSLQGYTATPHSDATGKRLWSQNLQRCLVATRGRCHNSSGRGCVWWRDSLAVSLGLTVWASSQQELWPLPPPQAALPESALGPLPLLNS